MGGLETNERGLVLIIVLLVRTGIRVVSVSMAFGGRSAPRLVRLKIERPATRALVFAQRVWTMRLRARLLETVSARRGSLGPHVTTTATQNAGSVHRPMQMTARRA
jgi:hypothetical protein